MNDMYNTDMIPYVGNSNPDFSYMSRSELRYMELQSLFNESAELDSGLQSELCDLYDLSFVESVFSEGTNVSALQIFGTKMKQISDKIKKANGYVKAKNYDEATKIANDAYNELDDLEKEISDFFDNADHKAISTISGNLAYTITIFIGAIASTVSLPLAVVGGGAAVIKGLKDSIVQLKMIVSKIKSDDESLNYSDFNGIKITMISVIGSMKKIVRNIVKKSDTKNSQSTASTTNANSGVAEESDAAMCGNMLAASGMPLTGSSKTSVVNEETDDMKAFTPTAANPADTLAKETVKDVKKMTKDAKDITKNLGSIKTESVILDEFESIMNQMILESGGIIEKLSSMLKKEEKVTGAPKSNIDIGKVRTACSLYSEIKILTGRIRLAEMKATDEEKKTVKDKVAAKKILVKKKELEKVEHKLNADEKKKYAEYCREFDRDYKKQMNASAKDIKAAKAAANSLVTESANIDKEIQDEIEKLNAKGYKTKYSSAGHTQLRKKSDKDRDGVYYDKLYSDARIMFEDDYKFPDAPKYWEWKLVDGKSYLDIKPIHYNEKDGTPDEAFAKWKENYMGTLTRWVDSLPDEKVSKNNLTQEEHEKDQDSQRKENAKEEEEKEETVQESATTDALKFFRPTFDKIETDQKEFKSLLKAKDYEKAVELGKDIIKDIEDAEKKVEKFYKEENHRFIDAYLTNITVSMAQMIIGNVAFITSPVILAFISVPMLIEALKDTTMQLKNAIKKLKTKDEHLDWSDINTAKLVMLRLLNSHKKAIERAIKGIEKKNKQEELKKAAEEKKKELDADKAAKKEAKKEQQEELKKAAEEKRQELLKESAEFGSSVDDMTSSILDNMMLDFLD